jgi:hypothetical protein
MKYRQHFESTIEAIRPGSVSIYRAARNGAADETDKSAQGF